MDKTGLEYFEFSEFKFTGHMHVLSVKMSLYYILGKNYMYLEVF